MVTRTGTQQHKTRHKFKRPYRSRGKISLGEYFKQLNLGEAVHLKINSAVQKGQFFRRFHGLTGTVTGKRGFCYEVKIHDHTKEKKLYVHPIHLKPAGGK